MKQKRKKAKKKLALQDRLMGEMKVFADGYDALYGKKSHQEEIKKIREDTRKKYIGAAMIFFALFIAGIGFQFFGGGVDTVDGVLTEIKRPDRVDGALQIPTNVCIKTKEEELVKAYTLIVRPEEQNHQREEPVQAPIDSNEAYERELDKLIRQLNKSTELGQVVLPSKLESGARLTWEHEENNSLIWMGALVVPVWGYIYTNRFSKLKRREKEARASIIRELPEFMDKLVLLLNAGLVITTAFSKIVEDARRIGYKRDSYFYSQLLEIYKSVETANGSLAQGLRGFATRSGVREFMRLSNIISDNMDKGTALVEKLEREGEGLWFARKKQAEERGRIAETKLTLPLMILLLVLLMVTVAPAMMEM